MIWVYLQLIILLDYSLQKNKKEFFRNNAIEINATYKILLALKN
jgi:hypothetical protein